MSKFEKVNKKDLKENKKEKKDKKIKSDNKENKISPSVKFTILALILIAIFCVALTPVTLQNDTYYTIAIG